MNLRFKILAVVLLASGVVRAGDTTRIIAEDTLGYFPDLEYLINGGYPQGGGGGAQNLPLPPQIDATNFLNTARLQLFLANTNIISVFTKAPVLGLQYTLLKDTSLEWYLPFQTKNTLNYTNSPNGYMYSDLGFDFKCFPSTGGISRASSVVNQGAIRGKYWMNFLANTIINKNEASIGVSSEGVLKLDGGNIDLTSGSLFAGPDPYVNPVANFNGTNIGGFFPQFYDYADGIEDEYWAVSTTFTRPTMMLATAIPAMLGAPQISSGSFTATHNVRVPTIPFVQPMTFNTSIPVASSNRYETHLYFDAINQIYNLVCVPTNNPIYNNLRWDVRFLPNDGGLPSPLVRLGLISSNIFNAQVNSNALFLADHTRLYNGVFFDLADNLKVIVTNGWLGGSSRPNVYELTRASADWDTAVPSNAIYNAAQFFGAGYVGTQVPYSYAAYSALINNASNAWKLADGFSNTLGRIDLTAAQADLTETRIRADNFVSIDVTNMTGGVPTIEAPAVRFVADFQRNNLVVSNMIPAKVSRFNGQFYAYSRLWTNYTAGGITTTFHVLIVDYEDAGTLLTDLSIKATNVVVYDRLVVASNFLMTAQSLTLATGAVSRGILELPEKTEWSVAVLPYLKFLTNQGDILLRNNLAVGRFYGTDGAIQNPYEVIDNSGNITDASHIVRAKNLRTTGRWKAVVAGADYKFQDGFAAGELSAADKLQLMGNTLVLSNVVMTSSFGGLVISATNALGDTVGTTNTIYTGYGINVPIKPPQGDLTNTTIISKASPYAHVDHIWPGVDRGLPRTGVDYSAVSNNLTLGRLILNGGAYSTFNLRGTGTNNALYVDVLDLQGNTVILHPGSDPEVDASALNIDSNLKIYFCLLRINGTMIAPEKYETIKLLTNFVWMPGWNTSPSSTITPSGNLINTALRYSKVYDSDHDGVPNFYDATPLLSDAPAAIASQMAPASGVPVKKVITWKTFANSINTIFYSSNALGPFDTILTTTNIPANANEAVPSQYEDTSANPGPMRFYRVRVELSTP